MFAQFLKDTLGGSKAYRKDPEGYGGNQGMHILMGIVLALICSVAYRAVFNAWPYREHVWAFLAVGYVIREVLDGWRWWDSAEDWVFFSVWGAGSGE